MPPMRVEPLSCGLNGSLTSYRRSSPVPQHDTYSQWSSTERLMSETSGGTTPNPWMIGGSSAGSAGSAGMVMTFFAFHSPLPSRAFSSRYHMKIDDDRSASDSTTPTNP